MNNVLVVGGGIATPLGPFKNTMDILETGVLDRFGIKDKGIEDAVNNAEELEETVRLAFILHGEKIRYLSESEILELRS